METVPEPALAALGTFQGPLVNDDHPSLGKHKETWFETFHFIDNIYLILLQETTPRCTFRRCVLMWIPRLLSSLYYYLFSHIGYRITATNHIKIMNNGMIRLYNLDLRIVQAIWKKKRGQGKYQGNKIWTDWLLLIFPEE